MILIGRESLRGLLARRGVTFQRTKTWKEYPDLDCEAKLDRIEEVVDCFPDRVFAFDEVLAAERKERARIRSEKGIRWGGRHLRVAA